MNHAPPIACTLDNETLTSRLAEIRSFTANNLIIGFVARQAGCTVPTIRYCEEIGSLAAAARSEAGQRHDDDDAGTCCPESPKSREGAIQ